MAPQMYYEYLLKLLCLFCNILRQVSSNRFLHCPWKSLNFLCWHLIVTATFFSVLFSTLWVSSEYRTGKHTKVISKWTVESVAKYPERPSLVHHSLEINGVSASLVQKGSPTTKGRKETYYFLSSSLINLHRFCLETLYNREGLWEETEAVYVGVI